MQLVSPIMRKHVGDEVVNREIQPCGGANTFGTVHFVAKPGSRNYIAWKVNNPAPLGNCTVRLGMGPDESDLTVLYPLDNSANADGSFPCGRRETPIEGKEFKFPYNFTCDDCTLQLEWQYKTKNQTVQQQHYCGDVDVIEKESPECVGQCKNGGVCMNGECRCRKGYYGSSCQHVISPPSNIGGLIFYFLLYTALIVLIAALFYGAYIII